MTSDLVACIHSKQPETVDNDGRLGGLHLIKRDRKERTGREGKGGGKMNPHCKILHKLLGHWRRQPFGGDITRVLYSNTWLIHWRWRVGCYILEWLGVHVNRPHLSVPIVTIWPSWTSAPIILSVTHPTELSKTCSVVYVAIQWKVGTIKACFHNGCAALRVASDSQRYR